MFQWMFTIRNVSGIMVEIVSTKGPGDSWHSSSFSQMESGFKLGSAGLAEFFIALSITALAFEKFQAWFRRVSILLQILTWFSETSKGGRKQNVQLFVSDDDASQCSCTVYNVLISMQRSTFIADVDSRLNHGSALEFSEGFDRTSTNE